MPGESHGQMRLVGYSAWGHTESDTTERLTTITDFKITRKLEGQIHGEPGETNGTDGTKPLRGPQAILTLTLNEITHLQTESEETYTSQAQEGILATERS